MASSPYLRENPRLSVLPRKWDHIPSLRELRQYGSTAQPELPFPIFPGLDYLWCLADNRDKAEEKGWGTLRGVDTFTIAGRTVFLMAKGEILPDGTLDATEPVLCVDPQLYALVNKPVVPAAQRTERTDKRV